jgi:small GTP-binding protein
MISSEQDLEMLCRKAKELAKLKLYEEALVWLEKALRIDSKAKDALLEKGNILLLLGKIENALDYFNKVTLLYPNFSEGWKKKEATHLIRCDYKDALECLNKLLQLEPQNHKIWAEKGMILSSLKMYREAIACFDKAIKLNPESPELIIRRDEALKHIEGDLKVRKIIKKICLLGDPSVGKTCLIRRYVYDVFDDKYISTIGAKVTKKVMTLKSQKISADIILTLMIWDIGGQEYFGTLHPTYYEGADGALLVCDITRDSTLINIPRWVSALFRITGEVPVVLLGNKIDLVEQAAIDERNLADIAKKLCCNYLFTSAKTGQNVENAFLELSKILLLGTSF